VLWPRWAARHRIGSAGGRWSWMDEPVDGILGRDAELAEVQSFVGSGSGDPRPCSLRDRPGSARRHCGARVCRSRGHGVIGCSPAAPPNRRRGCPMRRSATCSTSNSAGAWRTAPGSGGFPAAACGTTVECRRCAPRRRRGGPSDRGSGGCGGTTGSGTGRPATGRSGGHPAAGRRPDRVHAPAPGVDLPRVQGRCEQALQEAEEDAGIRTTAHEHLAWVGIYRGDLAFAAKHASASRQGTRRTTDPAIRAESLSTFAMVEFLSGRVEPVRRPACREASNHPA